MLRLEYSETQKAFFIATSERVLKFPANKSDNYFFCELDGDDLENFKLLVSGKNTGASDLLNKARKAVEKDAGSVIDSLQNGLKSGIGADKRVQIAEILQSYLQSVIMLAKESK